MAGVCYGGMTYLEKLWKIVKNQSQLARDAGLAQPKVNLVLNEKREPSWDEMVRIARALKVSLDWLADDAQSDVPVPEYTEDERAIIKNFRASGMDYETAYRLWQTGQSAKPAGQNWTTLKSVKQRRLGKKDGA